LKEFSGSPATKIHARGVARIFQILHYDNDNNILYIYINRMPETRLRKGITHPKTLSFHLEIMPGLFSSTADSFLMCQCNQK
jgi:hypothetical protein